MTDPTPPPSPVQSPSRGRPEQAGRRELDELREAADRVTTASAACDPIKTDDPDTYAEWLTAIGILRVRVEKVLNPAWPLAAAPSPTGVQDGPLAASRCQVQEAGSGTCTWPSCGCGDA